MNYGLTAAAVLGVLALSAPKEPQHNLMKLPSFKGILEVRASIPGRMRLHVPSLSGSMDQAEQARSSCSARAWCIAWSLSRARAACLCAMMSERLRPPSSRARSSSCWVWMRSSAASRKAAWKAACTPFWMQWIAA